MQQRSTIAVSGLVGLAVAAALLTGCGGSSDAEAPATTGASTTTASSTTKTGTSSTDVVKEILATTVDPPGAPGRTLSLVRYTIPPGAHLAPHIHPGVQLATIRSGELTYTVVSGRATVRRAGATTDEIVVGPKTIELEAGDDVTEIDGMVHFGENDTDEPIVIEATLLTKDGEDLAVPVETTQPKP